MNLLDKLKWWMELSYEYSYKNSSKSEHIELWMIHRRLYTKRFNMMSRETYAWAIFFDRFEQMQTK